MLRVQQPFVLAWVQHQQAGDRRCDVMAAEQVKEFMVHLGTGAVSATISKTFIAPIER